MASTLMTKSTLLSHSAALRIHLLMSGHGSGNIHLHLMIQRPHSQPSHRYWVPDASVDLADVENDFELIAQAGLGGMELLGYYLYGNYPSVVQEGGPVPVDWTEYGWGSEAWSSLLFRHFHATLVG
jgi:hypothetical protein